MRTVDVRNLKFENIDWGKKEVRIIQSKTNEPLVLPLFDEIGWAIIDYLKNGRPKCDCQFVFVTHNEPHKELETSLYPILQKYLERAEISVVRERHHGMHALRHSLASILFEQGNPLPVISGILGHSDTKSTSVYLKVDLKQLRQCALEVAYDE